MKRAVVDESSLCPLLLLSPVSQEGVRSRDDVIDKVGRVQYNCMITNIRVEYEGNASSTTPTFSTTTSPMAL